MYVCMYVCTISTICVSINVCMYVNMYTMCETNYVSHEYVPMHLGFELNEVEAEIQRRQRSFLQVPSHRIDEQYHPTVHMQYIHYVHTYIYAYIRTYIHTYIHTYIRTYIHALHTYI